MLTANGKNKLQGVHDILCHPGKIQTKAAEKLKIDAIPALFKK